MRLPRKKCAVAVNFDLKSLLKLTYLSSLEVSQFLKQSHLCFWWFQVSLLAKHLHVNRCCSLVEWQTTRVQIFIVDAEHWRTWSPSRTWRSLRLVHQFIEFRSQFTWLNFLMMVRMRLRNVWSLELWRLLNGLWLNEEFHFALTHFPLLFIISLNDRLWLLLWCIVRHLL